MARAAKTLNEVVEKPGITGEEAEQQRKLAGLKLANNQLVKAGDDGFYVVSDDGRFHVTKKGDKTVCTCSDFTGADTIGVTSIDKSPYACEHIYAVRAATTDVEFNKEEMKEVPAVVQPRQETSAEQDQGGSFGESPAAIVSQLERPLPKELIRTREVSWGRGYVEYVQWTTVVRALNRLFGDRWDYHVKELQVMGSDYIAATVALTIVDSYGSAVSRFNVGVGKVAGGNAEMAIKGAVSDGIKRCAALFGFALELYEDDEETAAPSTERKASFNGAVASKSNGNPMAQNLGDMVTAKQLNMIRAIANNNGIDAEAVCGEVFACRIDEISKKAASDLIGRLQAIEQGQAPPPESAEPAAAVPVASGTKW